MLRDAARLGSTNLMNLRTNVKWADKDLYTKIKQAINEICASEI